MNKKIIIITTILIIFGLVLGYVIYQNLETEQVIVGNQFLATESGQIVEEFAKCPVGKKAISGNCKTVHNQSIFKIYGQEPTKSNPDLENNDAWVCFFRAMEPGLFNYNITVNCR